MDNFNYKCSKCGCVFRCTNVSNLSEGYCYACGADWPEETVIPVTEDDNDES